MAHGLAKCRPIGGESEGPGSGSLPRSGVGARSALLREPAREPEARLMPVGGSEDRRTLMNRIIGPGSI